ncbi:nucleotidyltransferase family protein [Cohnella soli]|uniref:Nucleotidyltransferase family protein n=1 Tax=Cohnella soli TaxID=425005 RepID=A0ABW0HPF1_9BACL
MSTLQSVMVRPESTILEALQVIESGTLQIALVVDDRKVLLGTITDGDIRRGLLRGESLNSSVTTILNNNPITAKMSDSHDYIFSLMKRKQLRQIPVVDYEGRVVKLELLDRIISTDKRDNWVVLMAGGLGSRLGALTKDTPKPLLRINNKPILEIILENFIASGFHRFYISINYKWEMIQDYFGDGSRWGVEIRYLHEKERLGTAGSLSLIKDKPQESLLVINGDLLTKVDFQHLLDYHNDMNAIATMCVRDYELQVPYGVIKVDSNKLTGIEEKPIQRYFINGGIYVIDPSVLEYIPSNTFFDMPTLFEQLIEKKRNTIVFPIREYWIDIGRLDDFERAAGEFAQVFA